MSNDEVPVIRNLIMFCCLVYPRTNAMLLSKNWERHKVLGTRAQIILPVWRARRR